MLVGLGENAPISMDDKWAKVWKSVTAVSGFGR
jgi:hypothetical protein